MIGIFDSGSGGLTVVRAIRELLPSADIVYFGDIKNAPYGDKSFEELARLTIAGLKLLMDQGATSIVSACNSVSASLAVSLFDALELEQGRLIEMVGPTVSYFKNSSGRLLLVATPATIRSGIYQNAFRMIGMEIAAVPIPDLARLIEFGGTASEIEQSIRTALTGMPTDIDAVVLACTHYPLAYETFRRVIKPEVAIVDPALAVAARVEKRFWPREVGNGETQFVISKESEPFRAFVARLFPNTPSEIEVLS